GTKARLSAVATHRASTDSSERTAAEKGESLFGWNWLQFRRRRSRLVEVETALHEHEEQRHEENREEGRGQGAADHGAADRVLAPGAGATGDRQWQHAEHEGQAGHDDG